VNECITMVDIQPTPGFVSQAKLSLLAGAMDCVMSIACNA